VKWFVLSTEGHSARQGARPPVRHLFLSFSLGCTAALALYPHAVAIASIGWLVVGTVRGSAALEGCHERGGAVCVRVVWVLMRRSVYVCV